jgi:hypothetical protein
MAYKTKEKLVEEAIKRYRKTIEDWGSNHRDMAEDQEFLAGYQPNNFFGKNQQVYNENNPQVVVDLLSSPMSQLENTLRSNDYSMTVHRNTQEIDEDFLQIIAGKLKSIEVDSDAKQQIVKASGKNGMLVLGVGFIKVYTEYVDDKSFDQRIKFKGFSDNLKILPSFNCQDTITFSDAEFWLEYEVYTEDQYEELFGDSDLAKNSIGPPIGETQGMYEQGMYTVLKYWYKDVKYKTLYEYADGTITDDNDEAPIALLEEQNPDTGEIKEVRVPVPLVRKRKVKDEENSKVKWIITNGYEILDEDTWHNDTFPFVGFVGNFSTVKGKKIWYGGIRNCKTSQLMYNFYASQNAKRLATSGVSPWIAAAEQVADDRVRQLYENSHWQPTPLLVYKPAMNGQQPIQEPHRTDVTQPDIQGTQASMVSTKQDILSTLGVSDFAMANTMQGSGNKVNPSGVAVSTLAQQGQLNNLNYTDNFVSSYKRLSTIILELFSYVYDTPREETIIAADGSHKPVWINRQFMDQESGQMKLYNFEGLKSSTLMVTVDTGPAFADKASETVEQLERVGAVIPGAASIMAPVMVRNMDFVGHDELADKLEAYAESTMPWLAKMTESDIQGMPGPARKIITQLQQQNAQLEQQMQTQGAQLQKLTFEQKANIVDNEGKLKIAVINAHTDIVKQQAELQRQAESEKDEAKLELIRGQIEAANDRRDLLADLVKHSDKMALEHRKIDEKSKIPVNSQDKSINKTKADAQPQVKLQPLVNKA